MKYPHQTKLPPLGIVATSVLLLLCITFGCRSKCGGPFSHPCDDIPPGAMPQPIGAHACGWQETQAANAERDDFVVYQYEWIGHTTTLGPFGTRHLKRLGDRVAEKQGTIVIEASDDSQLDQQRLTMVVEMLNSLGQVDAERQVVIGRGQAEGLSGQEAPPLANGYLSSGVSGGNANGGGGNGGNGNAGGFGGTSRSGF